MSTRSSGAPAEFSYPFEDVVSSRDQLRSLMGEAMQGALDKEITFLDPHARNFIEHSPLLLLATASADGRLDVSPKGDPAGFVKVLDEKTLVIPDRLGNRRLDGFENILENPRIGLLFLVPGRDETLRVNGKAMLIKDQRLLETMSWRGKVPSIATAVEAEQVYFHCGKAFIRSQLWNPESWGDPSEIASFGKILIDQVGITDTTEAELNCVIEDAYANKLY